jgi:predicted cobalt transporter CbtA
VVFRTISTALLAGVVAGFCLFVIQRSSTLLLIHTAETYEKTASVAAPPDALAKEPMRSVATLLGDFFLAIAFGLLLTGFYAFSGIDGWLPGLLCGLVGFASFHLAPAMIVPPACTWNGSSGARLTANCMVCSGGVGYNRLHLAL